MTEMSARDQDLAERIGLNIANMTNCAIETSESYKPPKKKVLWSIKGIPISLAVLFNTFLVISVPTILILMEYMVVPATKNGFYCKDPLYSHKYTGDTISTVTLAVTGVTLPVLVLLLTEYTVHESFKKMNLCRMWIYLQECLVGVVVVLTLTMVSKSLIGEHRPHFFDMCQPDTARNCTEGQFVETYECTNTEYSWLDLADSSLSYPSGHSSTSWFLGMFSAYVIQTRLTTVNTGSLMKPFLMSVCLSWSLVCSLTRITDRRHHWWDVLAGTILGILCSLISMTIAHKKILAMEKELANPRIKETDGDMA